MANPTSIRLLVAEDVPQVSQHVRNLLSVQSQVKLLEVLNDGSKVVEAARQLRPDVVMVDLLLQGKLKGPAADREAARFRAGHPGRRPDRARSIRSPATPNRGIDAVLTLPFSGFELVNTLSHVLADRQARVAGACRVVSVFSPKGGVGKTTIAFNLAVALGQLGVATALIDGSLQYGDLRALLKVPSDVAVDPGPADRPGPGVGPARRDVARSGRHRHPAGPAARRDGGDGHRARRREDDLAPAPALPAPSSSTRRRRSPR